jgi:hypothetical protein
MRRDHVIVTRFPISQFKPFTYSEALCLLKEPFPNGNVASSRLTSVERSMYGVIL